MTPRRRTALIETAPMQTALMLVVAIGSPVIIGLVVADRRGWPVGVVCGLVFALLFGLGTRPSAREWSRRHPLADGAILGPLTFVLACLITVIPLVVAVAVGLAAGGFGGLRGAQRRRRWRAADDTGES